MVLTMDYSQNLTLPSVPDTPSGWYFLSLISVSLFGVYCANDRKHYSYMYTERKGGKGPNEIISMVHNVIELQGATDADSSDDTKANDRSLILWADNCGGQNKNSFVVWYLMFLVEYGIFQEATLKFLIKGHTKNPCDRGFGFAKKKVAKNECWNMEELVDCVAKSSTAIEPINLEEEDKPFRDFKLFLSRTYKKLNGIRKYQIFRVVADKKGYVECRQTPTSQPMVTDLRIYSQDDVFPPLVDAWDQISRLASPSINPEKIAHIHEKILPFVPDEYKADVLYQAPSEQELEKARDVKRARRQVQTKKRRVVEDEGKENLV